MDEGRSSRQVAWILLLLGIALLPVLYVLAFGPAEWLFVHGYLNPHEPPGRLVLTIYRPLVLLIDACPPAKHVVVWYVSLWV
jgi:hypothetical protein